MADIDLKIWPVFFDPITSGVKTFEVRHDDRGFRVGDRLHLREWDMNKASRAGDEDVGYTGRDCHVRVTYILPKRLFPGIDPDYVAMAIVLDPDVS